jgi:hypothetical protein
MPKKEKLVKTVTTDDNGERHITWERQMVDENTIRVIEPPLGIITLPLGKVFIERRGTNHVKRCKVKEKVFSGDKLITKKKSRLAMRVPHLFGGGEFRMGQEAELIVTAEYIKLASEKGGITRKQQKDFTMWGAFIHITTREADMTTIKLGAVAGIIG